MVFPVMLLALGDRVPACHFPTALRTDQQAGKQVDSPGLIMANGSRFQKLLHPVKFLWRDQGLTVSGVITVDTLVEWIGQHTAGTVQP